MKADLKWPTREYLVLSVGTILAPQRQPLSVTSWDLLGHLMLFRAVSLDRPEVKHGWMNWTADQERCGLPTALTVGGEWRTATTDRMLVWSAMVCWEIMIFIRLCECKPLQQLLNVVI